MNVALMCNDCEIVAVGMGQRRQEYPGLSQHNLISSDINMEDSQSHVNKWSSGHLRLFVLLIL